MLLNCTLNCARKKRERKHEKSKKKFLFINATGSVERLVLLFFVSILIHFFFLRDTDNDY